LFSATTTSGSFWTAAKFSPSWKAPVDVPPSPIHVIATRSFFCMRPARAMPAMTGMRAPSIEIGEMTPRSGLPKCRLQSLPPDGEVPRAMYCVMTSRAE
jgi:hypothetical protein